MRKRIMAASGAGLACLVMSFGGTAFAATQPANLGNVANVDRGASAPGPHCHFVLPAAGHHFDAIIGGAAHEAHMATGTPTGIFQATACP